MDEEQDVLTTGEEAVETVLEDQPTETEDRVNAVELAQAVEAEVNKQLDTFLNENMQAVLIDTILNMSVENMETLRNRMMVDIAVSENTEAADDNLLDLIAAELS